jgi:hypothetical protein
MKNYKYIRANALIRDWSPFCLQVVLAHAWTTDAPDDAFTYVPGEKNPWRTVKDLREEAAAGNKASNALLNRLEVHVG